MSEKRDFSYESLQDPESIGQYLRALADGIAAGHLTLKRDGNEIVLEPRGLLRCRIVGKRKRQRAQLVFKVSWRVDDPSEQLDASTLEISSNPS